ncbi:hypothetical protein CRYUN_Cryun01aG0137600 [Craigia yunnanensis]
MFYIGMEPCLQRISELVLSHLLRNGKVLTLVFLHGLGFLVINTLGLLLPRLLFSIIFNQFSLQNNLMLYKRINVFLVLQEEGYLSLEKICISRPNEEDIDQSSQTDTGEEETSCLGNEDVIDDATLVQSNHHELHYYDFHIVYSNTFRIPVLYLRAYSSDGRPLPLDEIEKELPTCSSKELSKSKWTFITQEEHPHLKRPWYKLHPCGTGEWMKLLFLSDTSQPKFEVVVELYLLSWFSVVGQVVGLRIPFKMLNHRS